MSEKRFFSQDLFYHVYNRGNRKQTIFEQPGDYLHFLQRLEDFKKIYPVELISFCLMPNHFHFLIKPKEPRAISQLISRLCNSHSRFYNIKYETVGGLFQGRFKDKSVEKDEYFVHLSRYIHLNPLKFLPNSTSQVEIIEFLEKYPWSSYREFVSGNYTLVDNPESLLSLGYFSHKDPQGSYRKFVLDGISQPHGVLPDDLLLE